MRKIFIIIFSALSVIFFSACSLKTVENENVSEKEKNISPKEEVVVSKAGKVFQASVGDNALVKLPIDDSYKLLDFSYDTYLPHRNYLFLQKENKIFLYNIKEKHVQETSLPELKIEKQTENIYEELGNAIFSADGSEVALYINTYDKKSKEFKGSDFIGGPQPSRTRVLTYSFLKNEWKEGSILREANELIKENYAFFTNWDSQSRKAYGHLSSEGIGNAPPLYVFDGKTKEIQKTSEFKDEEITPFFSPSLKKFVLVNQTSKTLLLFNSSDLQNPSEVIDIGLIYDQECKNYKDYYKNSNDTYCPQNVSVVAWSSSGEQIALGLETQIYTINLNSKKIDLRFSDKDQGDNFFWEHFVLAYSSQDKQLLFVDLSQENDISNDKRKLTSIDLENNVSMVLTESNEEIKILTAVKE